MKKQMTAKSAWLVCDHQEQLIDYVNGRADIGRMIQYAKDLYVQRYASISEKIYFQHYTKGGSRKKSFFEVTAPVRTSFQTKEYAEMMEAFRVYGMDSKEYRELEVIWRKVPTYIFVGFKPGIEIYRIHDVSELEENHKLYLLYTEDTVAGERRTVKREI